MTTAPSETDEVVEGGFTDEPLTTRALVVARANLAQGFTSEEDGALLDVIIPMASALVRHHGLPWPTRATAPDVVVSITTEAAARVLMNPEGLSLERGDAVTFGRDDVLGLELSDSEKDILENLRDPFAGSPHAVYSVYAGNMDTPLPRALNGRERRHGAFWRPAPNVMTSSGLQMTFFHEDDCWGFADW